MSFTAASAMNSFGFMPLPVVWLNRMRSALPYCFNDGSPRHYGIIREVSQELDLIARDVLKGFDAFPGFQLQDPVHHDEWESLL